MLICNDPNNVNSEKLRHTSGWGIPTVSGDWLWISIQAGYKKPYESYLLQRLQSQIENRKMECPDQLVQNPQSVERKQSTESDPPEESADSRQAGQSARSPSVRNGASDDVTTNKESDPFLKGSFPNLSTNAPYYSLGSPSPNKDQDELGVPAVPLQRRESSESRLSNSTSAASKALDLAVSGLLKKARARSHLSLIASDTNERPQPKRRKPLLGRASSYSSTNAFGRQGASRASSIDSLNGCDDSIDGLDMESNHNTNRNNLNGQSFHSVLSGGDLSIYGEPPLYDTEYQAEREAEDQSLLMTQLNYEDPDAVAMRQEFMRRAGKLENEEQAPRTLVLGELKDLDTSRGWGSGKRTRRARKATEAEDSLF